MKINGVMIAVIFFNFWFTLFILKYFLAIETTNNMENNTYDEIHNEENTY